MNLINEIMAAGSIRDTESLPTASEIAANINSGASTLYQEARIATPAFDANGERLSGMAAVIGKIRPRVR